MFLGGIARFRVCVVCGHKFSFYLTLRVDRPGRPTDSFHLLPLTTELQRELSTGRQNRSNNIQRVAHARSFVVPTHPDGAEAVGPREAGRGCIEAANQTEVGFAALIQNWNDVLRAQRPVSAGNLVFVPTKISPLVTL